DLTISVQQVLTVEPLFQADVRAQVAGVVRSVPVGIGTRVSLGATLVEIDVPQLEAEVVQKRAVVNQREIEVLQAEAAVANAIAFRQGAERTTSQRIAEKRTAEETRDLRKLRLDRYIAAAEREGVKKSFVEEEERDYKVAVHAVESAQAGILKAQAEL